MVPALSSALAEMGMTVDLLGLKVGDHDEGHIFPESKLVNTILAPCVEFKRLRLFWSREFSRILFKRARRLPDAVIHDHGLWQPTNFSAAHAARRLGIPYIISPHGTVSPWALTHRWLKKKIAWGMYVHQNLQSARVLHATSMEEADHLRKLGLTQPIAIVPNGVAVPENLSRIPNSSGVRTALYMGRIHRSKGLLNLVHAWAKARPENWKVILAGPDEENHQAEVEAALAQTNLKGVFEFAGLVEREQKWDLYRRADLFILPTFTENFGLTVAEALAAGVPVITTHGAPWADLETHRCGWWVEIGADPLAVALKEAISLSSETREEMGARGRTLVRDRFLWPRIAEEMQAVYRWALGLGERPACVVG
jgi:glycosyltransferase involved in cell wall biosynthesis